MGHSANKIKNIALAGHGGSGKTSLAEALLFYTKATDRLGKVADGTTVCDFDAEEIKRHISVSVSIAPFIYKDFKVNLIDTPGLFDFEGELYEGIRPAESVIIALSGKSGVTVGAEKAYKEAVKNNKATMFFVSKLDTENADFYKVLEELKTIIGPSVCPVIVPHYENHAVSCYINLLTLKAYKYKDGIATEVLMPNTGHRLDGLIVALTEAIAETDDSLMEKFFNGEQFTKEEMLKGLKLGVRNGIISPVYCGSSYTFDGIDQFLEGISELLPTAADNKETAVDKSGVEVSVSCSESEPLSAFVFKTVADPFVGKMSYVKVMSGTLRSDASPVNARTGNPERLGKIMLIKGKKQDEASAVSAGDIAAISKLSETVTGDTLCDAKRIISFKPVTFPHPCMTMAIKPKSKGDETKISQGLTRLMEEDPTLKYENNTETHQQLITGMGEQHLDVITSKLKSKFGVEVILEAPKIAYRETIRKKVKVEGKHKKQSGGHGQFGHVWIEFEPSLCDGLEFCDKVFGGAVPKNFFPAVEKGLRDSISRGVLAGYPIVGLKATLVDGSYHPVDSSEMSFKMAAAIAYKSGIPLASPVILEPIGTLRAYVPDSNTGDIIGELNKRRGRVLGMNPDEDNLQLIEAEVPLSEMYDFTTALRSMTQGRGKFTLDFCRYEQLPQNLEASVIEASKELKANSDE